MNTLCPPEKSRLDNYLDAVECLPPTPTLMIKLIELFRQPDRDADEIVELMRHEPSLTAEVLRQCNTSFFGNDEPVTDINEALFRLGFYEVYRIAVALFSVQSMSAAKVSENLGVDALWRHSARTAIVGGTLARKVGESEGVVFTAGLLHDVGKIVLASAEGARYAELIESHGGFGAAANEAERIAFGFDHCEIGARLLNRWGVPEEVFVPVMRHHQVAWSGPIERLAAIVNLANLMAHCLDGTAREKPCELPEGIHALEVLNLNHEDMPTLENLARSDLKRLGSLLAITTVH